MDRLLWIDFYGSFLYDKSLAVGIDTSKRHPQAGMAELADAQDLGSCGEIHMGSTPIARTTSERDPLHSVPRRSLLGPP